jgi:hypothetical protein
MLFAIHLCFTVATILAFMGEMLHINRQLGWFLLVEKKLIISVIWLILSIIYFFFAIASPGFFFYLCASTLLVDAVIAVWALGTFSVRKSG